ncbi:MAG TPA: DUF4139 domain-containing protein [Gammaproteobacteria bacterium]|nr:DUF4139 domain-containing protein [Gammaproteobacteria bacterium]
MHVGNSSKRSAGPARAAALAAAIAAAAPFCAFAQDDVGATALTIYSTARPGAVPPELYRPVPGQGGFYGGQQVPGYAMIRQERTVDLKQGVNRLNFRDVAAYIDPTTVTFESLTAPGATRVIEQSFEFDLVSTEKLMEKYLDQTITVDQLAGDRIVPIKGKLLSTLGGLVLASDNGEIHAITSYQNVHFPTLPGGLKTRPTLVWDVDAQRGGRESTRLTYQTAGVTWWADYNLVWTDGADANHGTLDVGAWVSILNRSGTTYDDAKLKLIAGDVNRAQPAPVPFDAMRKQVFAAAEANAGFAEQSFFEFHLYTLGRNTTIADNSTMQIELFPKVLEVPAEKQLVYYGFQPGFGFPSEPAIDRNYGLPANTKVDVYLKFANRENAGLGIPLPAGRIRVSQLDKKDDALEFIGEDVIDHTPKDEPVRVKLGSAFDVVGERRQVDFQIDSNARRMEETIEVKVRNHKNEPVDVVVHESLFRWAQNDVVEASQRYDRIDARTVEFPVKVAKDGEATVRYKVRYRW